MHIQNAGQRQRHIMFIERTEHQSLLKSANECGALHVKSCTVSRDDFFHWDMIDVMPTKRLTSWVIHLH